MDQPTALFLTALVTAMGTAVPATMAVIINGHKASEDRKATLKVVRETAERGRQARVLQGDMQTTIDEVHAQVSTLNGLTMGQLADAEETRRVSTIPSAGQTKAEKQHVAAIPLPKKES